MVAFFITALQFLDMMPLLWNFPFGRGESSYDIKLVSKFLQADSFLQAMATIFLPCSSSCPCCSCCWWWMKQHPPHQRAEGAQRAHADGDPDAHLENRTYMELRHLVHDLSPL